MTVFTANSAAELTSTLAKAQDGDTIQLASGSYGKLVLKDIQIAGNVTITSADPANPAVINGLLAKNCDGLTFSNLDFYNPVEGLHNAFQLLGSKNITLDNLEVHGPSNMGSGLEVALLMVRNTTNVTVTNSEFHDGWQAINMLDNNGLTVANNYIHNIRTDGVRGGGNSDLIITKNTFTDFFPNSIDHPDAIQLWTNNTTASATNVTISDNLIMRGQGAQMQGIFMRDIVGNLPFMNMNITGNIIAGGLYNGIAVEHVGSGTITDNIIAGFADQRSWIRADNSTNLTVANNQATFYQSQMKAEQGVNGNTLIADSTDGGAAWISSWLAKFSGFSTFWGGNDSAMLTDLGLLYDPSLLGSGGSTTTTDTSTPSPDSGSGTTDGGTTETPTSPPATETQSDGGSSDAGSSDTGGGTTDDTGQAPDATDASSGSTTDDAGPAGNDAGPVPQGNILTGGNGNDVYFVKSSNDIVVEGVNGGHDTVRASVDYTLGDNVEDLRLEVVGLTGTGNALDNRIVGWHGDETMYGLDGDDLIQGRGGNDTMYGGNGNDDLRGDDGADKLFGEAGNDELWGGAGNDVIDGGAGNDIFEGGAGDNIMTGGSGADIFRYRTDHFATYSADEITDFTRGVDTIALHMVELPGGGDFHFIGKKGFSHTVGELRYQTYRGDTIVQGDIDGDGNADFSIRLDHVNKVDASDFML